MHRLDLCVPRSHDDRALSSRGLGHRLDRIEQEIEDDLLELHAIGADDDRLVVEVDRDADVADDRIAGEHLDDLLHHDVQVERCALGLALAQKVAHALDHLARALAVVHDVGQDRLQLADIGCSDVEESEAGPGVGQDPRKRLVQLVGERGGQLSHHEDAHVVRDLLAASLEVQLRGLPRGDVGAGHDGAALRTVEANDKHREPSLGRSVVAGILEGEILTRSAQHSEDAGRGLVGLGHPAAGGLPPRLEKASAHAEPGRQRCAALGGDAAPVRVDIDDPAVPVQDGDGGVQRAQDRRLQRLAGMQGPDALSQHGPRVTVLDEDRRQAQDRDGQHDQQGLQREYGRGGRQVREWSSSVCGRHDGDERCAEQAETRAARPEPHRREQDDRQEEHDGGGRAAENRRAGRHQTEDPTRDEHECRRQERRLGPSRARRATKPGGAGRGAHHDGWHEQQQGQDVGEEPRPPDRRVRLLMHHRDHRGVEERGKERRDETGGHDEDRHPAQGVEPRGRTAQPPDAAGGDQGLAAVRDEEGEHEGARPRHLQFRGEVYRERGEQADPPPPRRHEQQRRSQNGVRRPHERRCGRRESENEPDVGAGVVAERDEDGGRCCLPHPDIVLDLWGSRPLIR